MHGYVCGILSNTDNKIRGHGFERRENEGDVGGVGERRIRGVNIVYIYKMF